MMADTRPAPDVPDLGPDNAVDLEKLGDADLETWVKYTGIAEGDEFWPKWWGRTAHGEAVDVFNELVQIGPGDLKPQGMLVSISNAKLKALDQGQVFYSYRMYDADTPDKQGEESQRRFFYVGKRLSASPQLPVPQLKESHALAVDPAAIGPGGATVVTGPYQAMSTGDKVTLILNLYFDEDDPWEPIIYEKELTDADIGKPLTWTIAKNYFDSIVGGFAHMNYRIDYATPTEPSISATQTVYVSPPPDTWLPAPKVIGYEEGDELDPDMYPQGLSLFVPLHDDAQVDDCVVVYASGATSLIKTQRVDPSTIDSRVIRVNLDHAWLLANQNNDISLMYQHARVGNAGTSKPLALKLNKPLYLPVPLVEKATVSGETGFLMGDRITGGVYIRIPEEAEIGVGNQVEMHWEGYGPTGSYIAKPMSGNAKRFFIPPAAVPPNIGKHLEVFYKVTPPGKHSKVFDLEIRDITSGWPTIQISSPPSPSNKVSLASVTTGVTFNLGSWFYMWSGQRVKIEVVGVLSGGGSETFPLRTGDKEVVTETENTEGEIRAILPRDFLEKLKLEQQFNVYVSLSLDGGNTYKSLPFISPQLIA